MLVELKTLKPNPFRDFVVDPYDDDNVEALAKSIKEDGFWGGVVCRQVNGHVQIGAGHHRVKAALKAGIKVADVFVGDLDDASMIRVYARENATQRGNSSTAVAGTVASAVRFLAKIFMTQEVSQICETFGWSLQQASQSKAALTKDGVGEHAITRLLTNVPGINEPAVKQQLASLKSSGDYARIIGEVKDEIEQEHREALKALEKAERERARIEQERKEAEQRERKAAEERKAATARARAAKEEADRKRAEEEGKRAEIAQQRAEAEAKLAEKRRTEADAQMQKFDSLRTMRDTANKAASKAAEREVTFDFEGVAKHLRNDNQVRVFRDVVTGAGVRPYLPVNKQGALAAELVRLSKSRGAEMSGQFIRDNVVALVLTAKSTEREFSKDEIRKAQEADLQRKMKDLQHDFSRCVRTMTQMGISIKEMIEKHKSVTFPIRDEFRNAVKTARQVIETLDKRI